MPIDEQIYSLPAVKGNVGSVALKTSVALDQIRAALTKLQENRDADITEELDEIQRISNELDQLFDRFAGWSSDGN
jgi:hypothetical protein